MNISSKAEYGIRAMIEIAGADGPVKRSDISERQQIPMPFLTQVMLALVNSGLLHSSRGPGGGYVLARPAADIDLLQIITRLQGPVVPKDCLNSNDGDSCKSGGIGCQLRGVWSDLKAANERVLVNVKLSDLSAGQGVIDARSIS